MEKNADRLRKDKGIRPKDYHMYKPELMKELGYPVTLDEYFESKGITYKTVEFELE